LISEPQIYGFKKEEKQKSARNGGFLFFSIAIFFPKTFLKFGNYWNQALCQVPIF